MNRQTENGVLGFLALIISPFRYGILKINSSSNNILVESVVVNFTLLNVCSSLKHLTLRYITIIVNKYYLHNLQPLDLNRTHKATNTYIGYSHNLRNNCTQLQGGCKIRGKLISIGSGCVTSFHKSHRGPPVLHLKEKRNQG